jgi:threonine aldolase
LHAAGASFYAWTTDSVPKHTTISSDAGLVRLVTSFATSPGEVDDFAAATTGAR